MNSFAPDNLQVGFTLVAAAVVFFMQAGFCMLESGLVRTKNSIHVAAKNMLDFIIALFFYTIFGFPLMFGIATTDWWGLTGQIDYWADDRLIAFFIFQAVFCSTASTIVSGAVAERTRLITYLFTIVLVGGLIYPIFGNWAWSGPLHGTSVGWLAKLGFVDWAGCVVVHVVGGFAALAAAQAIGPRRHIFHENITSGHSLTLAILGCFILWFGWWGFNGGSSLAVDVSLPRVILNTNLGGAAGGAAASLISIWFFRRLNVVSLINGVVAGLVAVTGACHVLNPVLAILVGAIGAILSETAVLAIKKIGIDDAIGAFAVHGAAGIWGAIAFALFAPEADIVCSSRWMQLMVQLLGALIAGGLSYFVVYAGLKFLGRFTRLRVKAGEELAGLNMVEHGATNEVVDLLVSMSAHRSTGDYSRDLKVEPFTESGQIAQEYNQVLARVRTEIGHHEETNQWLQSERLRLQSVLENAGVGMYQLDEQGRFVSANSTLLSTISYDSSDALIGQCYENLVPWHASTSDAFRTMRDAFDNGRPIQDLESQIKLDAEQTLWLLESLVPIRDERGHLLSWLGTVHNITERKQAMLAEVEIAEAKSQAKGAFLANMSHEIRTPLNGVIGMLDLMGNAELPQQQQHYVSIARSSADTLLSLINDILDFSKIESGRLELESVEFDLREFIESTVEQFSIRAHMKSLDLNCSIGEDLPSVVKGDPERLRQVIVNLLSNAIKFTAKGEINLRASRRGSVIRFGVQDTGIGIKPEVQERLFQAFTQADASTTRQFGGTGLGLAISSRLVRCMGGNLKVDSSWGEGSEFWFELELPTVQENRRNTLIVKQLLDQLPKARVLVVDDNTTNCEILNSQLSSWGFEVSICQQPKTAVERMLIANRLRNPIDLVILDFCMPEMDGKDVAEAIRRESHLDDVAIIMLSSNYELMSREEQDKYGISFAMSKPARQSRLLDSIMSVLHNRIVAAQDKSQKHDPMALATETLADSLKTVTNHSPEKNQNAFVPQSIIPDVIGSGLGDGFPSSLNESRMPNGDAAPVLADILVAEDNLVNQMVVRQMLRSLGFSSAVAENGQVALELVTEGRYGMILMDGHMPVLDGIEATKQIRQMELSEGRQRTPIVALTANVVQGVREQCLEAGMDDYLCKPITLVRLKEVIGRFLLPSSAESDPQFPVASVENCGDQDPHVVAGNHSLPTNVPVATAHFATTNKTNSLSANPLPAASDRRGANLSPMPTPRRRANDMMSLERDGHAVSPSEGEAAERGDVAAPLAKSVAPKAAQKKAAKRSAKSTHRSPSTTPPTSKAKRSAQETVTHKAVTHKAAPQPSDTALPTRPKKAKRTTNVGPAHSEMGASNQVVESSLGSVAAAKLSPIPDALPATVGPTTVGPAASPEEGWEQDLFDRSFLQQQCGGDDAFERQILEIMRDTLPGRIAELEHAFLANDLSEVRSIAHQLKGAAGDSSLTAIRQAASVLETQVIEKRVEVMDQSLEDLKIRVAKTLELLESVLSL